MPHPYTHGHFYWNELMTRDAEKAKKFYGNTVGWTFEAMTMPDGTQIDTVTGLKISVTA